jgi:hypothetical protein
MKKKSCACTASGVLLLMGVVQGGCDAQVDPGYEGEPLTRLKGRVSALAAAPAEADVGVLWFSDSEGQCSGPEQSCFYSASGAFSPTMDVACLEACGTMPECVEVSAIEEWEGCQQACGADIEVNVQVEYHACFTGAVGQTAPVIGDFPAQFSLDVLSPPPVEALLRSDTGERVAIGLIVALQLNGEPLTLDAETDDLPEWWIGGSESHFLAYAADPIAADSSWGTYLGGEYSVGYHLIRVVFGNRCGLARLSSEEDAEADSPGDAATEEPTPDTGGGSAEPSSEPEDRFEEPDYRGIPFVCGNGVCEQGENCDVCSDCIECDGTSPGMSSGLTSRDGEYNCRYTPSTFEKAPAGAESEIELMIVRPELIDWPAL